MLRINIQTLDGDKIVMSKKDFANLVDAIREDREVTFTDDTKEKKYHKMVWDSGINMYVCAVCEWKSSFKKPPSYCPI